MTDYTDFQRVVIPEANEVGWDVAMASTLATFDLAGSGNRLATLELDEAVDAYDAVGFQGAADLQHVVLATNVDPIEACGIVLEAGIAGDRVPVLMRGVLSLGTSINPAGPLTVGKSVFLGVDGALVYETDAARYGDPSGLELFQQRVGYTLRSSSGAEDDVLLIAPQTGHRAISSIVPSAPPMVLSGVATEAWTNVTGSRYARVFAVAAGVTVVMVYTFVLPNNFREVADFSGWAFRLNYMAAAGVSVKVTNVHGTDGVAHAPTVADTGTSATWAAHAMTGAELVDTAAPFAKGGVVTCEVTITGGAAGTSYVESLARLRYGPEWGTWGAAF